MGTHPDRPGETRCFRIPMIPPLPCQIVLMFCDVLFLSTAHSAGGLSDGSILTTSIMKLRSCLVLSCTPYSAFDPLSDMVAQGEMPRV